MMHKLYHNVMMLDDYIKSEGFVTRLVSQLRIAMTLKLIYLLALRQMITRPLI